jgi:hypothetical protein
MGTQSQVSDLTAFEVSTANSRLQEAISLYAVLAAEDCGRQLTVWDRLVGLITIVAVSAGGWTAIIALVRLLR